MDSNSSDPNKPNAPSGGNPQPDLSSTLGAPTPIQPESNSTPPSPVQSEPASPLPDLSQSIPPSPQPTWSPPSPEPTLSNPEPNQLNPNDQVLTADPTLAPPPAVPQEPIEQVPSSISPLDNPFNVPTQNPPIDAGITSQSTPTPPTPTFVPQPPSNNPSFSWSNASTQPQPIPEVPQNPPATAAPLDQPEPAPTDLSHLVDTSTQQPVYTPPLSQPETLVAPANGGGADVPNLPTENHSGGIPKWVIGVGAGLLLAVVAASAYFILGIGRPSETTSLPAVESQQINTPTVVQQQVPVVVSTPTATSSAGFGSLPGTGSSQATSAADLLRQRQGL